MKPYVPASIINTLARRVPERLRSAGVDRRVAVQCASRAPPPLPHTHTHTHTHAQTSQRCEAVPSVGLRVPSGRAHNGCAYENAKLQCIHTMDWNAKLCATDSAAQLHRCGFVQSRAHPRLRSVALTGQRRRVAAAGLAHASQLERTHVVARAHAGKTPCVGRAAPGAQPPCRAMVALGS